MRKKRLRIIIFVMVVIMLVGQMSGCTADQKSSSKEQKENLGKKPKKKNVIFEISTENECDYRIKNSEDALETLKRITKKNGISHIEDNIGTCRENKILTSTCYTFPQYYKGIPVYGRKITVETDSDGKISGVNGNFSEISNINLKEKINEKKAIKIVENEYKDNVNILKMGKTIFDLYNTSPMLTWQFCVKGEGVAESCLVNAHTGKIVFSDSNIDTDKESSNIKNIPQIDGKYVLSDQNRNINICDAKKEPIRVCFQDDTGNKYTPNAKSGLWYNKKTNYVQPVHTNGIWQLSDLSGNIICENAELKRNIEESDKEVKVASGDIDTIDASCIKAFYISCNTYDFCNEVLKRKGFDNKNGLTEVFVNEGTMSNNAFSYMGNKTEPTFLYLGYENKITPELVGHEYFHSVERTISGLSSKGESGALKEAFCDVMGELVEDWNDDRTLNDSCDWKHGARHMRKPSEEEYHYCLYEIEGKKCPVEEEYGTHKATKKKITEPTSEVCTVVYKYPESQMDENKFTYSDEDSLMVGKHVNSTIISHAFYSMVHPKKGSGITMEELAKLLYKSMGSLNYDDDFQNFATWLYYEAQKMNFSDQKLTTIKMALNNAGLPPEKVMVVKIEVPETAKKKNDIEISDYFSTYRELQELLNMKSTELWQFKGESGAESYMADEFYLEWMDEMFSMKNNGASYIKLYGITLGDKIDQATSELQKNGWKKLYDTTSGSAFVTLINDLPYFVYQKIDNNGAIQSWYLNNWPQGEDVSDAISELREEHQEDTSALPVKKTYEYANGQFLSNFTISDENGIKNASLMFWHDNGRSSSDEEFHFEWNDGMKEYDVVGARSNQKFHLYFEQTNEGIYIKVTCISGSYFSWQTGQEASEWVSENYLLKN